LLDGCISLLDNQDLREIGIIRRIDYDDDDEDEDEED